MGATGSKALQSAKGKAGPPPAWSPKHPDNHGMAERINPMLGEVPVMALQPPKTDVNPVLKVRWVIIDFFGFKSGLY